MLTEWALLLACFIRRVPRRVLSYLEAFGDTPPGTGAGALPDNPGSCMPGGANDDSGAGTCDPVVDYCTIDKSEERF